MSYFFDLRIIYINLYVQTNGRWSPGHSIKDEEAGWINFDPQSESLREQAIEATSQRQINNWVHGKAGKIERWTSPSGVRIRAYNKRIKKVNRRQNNQLARKNYYQMNNY